MARPLSHASSRRSSARVRRLRLVTALIVLIATGLIVFVALPTSGGSPPRGLHSAPSHPSHHPAEAPLPAAESGLLPWPLAAPISRLVVLPGAGSDLILLGGLTTGDTSSSGVFTLDTSSGTLAHVGDLSGPLHDAAGSVIGGQDVIFGGGAATTVATVQDFPPPSASPVGAGSTAPTATVVGALPQTRADSAATTIGSTTYVVGGYDGTNPDPDVLATTDGRTFRSVASLAIPVRYAAVAALAGKIYVFGGQAVTGATAGQPTDVVQVVDPARHTATVAAARLPEPLMGAAAATVAGHIYLLGGDSSTPQSTVAGVGSTQLTPSPSPSSGPTPAIADGQVVTGTAGTAVLTGAERGNGPNRGTVSAAASTTTVNTIWAFDPASMQLRPAGHLQVPVSHTGVAVIGSTAWIVGGESGGAPVAAVQMLTPNLAFGTAGASGAGSPYFGANLLIADRGNNRLLVMNAAMQVVWSYPSPTLPPDPLGFYFPDDAFFVNKGTAIISNQEQNETIVEIGYPSGRVVWSYGHPKQPGSATGYLHEPDDAYLLKNGQITVADAQNCRVLVLNPNGTVADQVGTTGVCVHNPPASMGSPNGDTPLADGNLLVSEVDGAWVSEYTPSGSLVWTLHPPISYPSDPQQLGPDLYLVADYATPGQVLEFNRAGQILYRYDVASGPGMLDHPSLAEVLPSGVIMANDDYRNRMVAFDPHTDALVWQYGINDQAGTAPGMLNIPDGFDIVLPNGSTPTHSATG